MPYESNHTAFLFLSIIRTGISRGELNNPYILDTLNFITHLGLMNSSAKLFNEKTLLMAMYGATARKVSILEINACTNQAICAISQKNDFYLYYLRYALMALNVYLINLSTGSARDNLSHDKIKALIIMLPPDSILIEFNLFWVNSPSLATNLILYGAGEQLIPRPLAAWVVYLVSF